MGLTSDRLIGARVVTAEGAVVDTDDDPDLLWALRGGGNFGVLTQLHFQLEPLGPIVRGGVRMYPLERGREVLTAFRDVMMAAPKELCGGLALLTAPPAPFVPEVHRGTVVVSTIVMWAGDDAEADAGLAALDALGEPIVDLVAPRPYTEIQQIMDPGAPAGHRDYFKGGFMSDLSDAAIADIVGLAEGITEHLTQIICAPLGHHTQYAAVDGEDDASVPIAQSEAFAAALSAAGVDVELRRVPGAGHLWRDAADPDAELEAGIAFAARVTGRRDPPPPLLRRLLRLVRRTSGRRRDDGRSGGGWHTGAVVDHGAALCPTSRRPPLSNPVRVLHVPGDHDYVAHLCDDRVTGVEVVRGVEDDGAGWGPSPALDAAWVAANIQRFDVLHVHFGFESRTPDQLRELVAVLRKAHRPLVVTVHDLQNPHLREQDGYTELLDVLIPAAEALVSLTPGAADEVRRRWDRRCAVVPHPHVAPLREIGLPRPDRSPRVVGVHLKSLRASLLALPVLQALADAIGRLPLTRLRVDVHDDALDPTFPRHDAELAEWLHAAADTGAVDLRVHGRFDDAALLAYLRELDVSVLAYGHGTHSGWLELCHDLGVPVVAGPVGYLHQQQALVQVDLRDPRALAEGLEVAMAGIPGSAATAAGRLAQRLDVAAAHRELYRRVAQS